MNQKIIIGVLVVCLLTFVAVFAFSQSSSNVRWEYMFIEGWMSNHIQRANQLGREGWELITVQGSGSGSEIIFKRRLP